MRGDPARRRDVALQLRAGAVPVLSALVPEPMMGVPDRIASTPAHEPAPRYTTVVGGVCIAIILPISAQQRLRRRRAGREDGRRQRRRTRPRPRRARRARPEPDESMRRQRRLSWSVREGPQAAVRSSEVDPCALLSNDCSAGEPARRSPRRVGRAGIHVGQPRGTTCFRASSQTAFGKAGAVIVRRALVRIAAGVEQERAPRASTRRNGERNQHQDCWSQLPHAVRHYAPKPLPLLRSCDVEVTDARSALRQKAA